MMTTTESQSTGSLLGKIATAQKSAKAVGKQGENRAQGYKYARAEDVIGEARRALHDAGLIAAIDFNDLDIREVTSKGGGSGMFAIVRAVLQIADPESAEVFTVHGYGTGTDYPGDKAIYKAMTGAAKYAYASALGIPFGDDPEDEATSTAPAASEGTRAEPTDKQLDFLDKLLKRQKDLPTEERLIITDYARQRLQRNVLTKTIDGVKDDPADWVPRLRGAAAAWNANRPLDVPLDDADLPPADEPDQDTLISA